MGDIIVGASGGNTLMLHGVLRRFLCDAAYRPFKSKDVQKIDLGLGRLTCQTAQNPARISHSRRILSYASNT